MTAIEAVCVRNWHMTINDLFKPDRHREIVDRRRCVLLAFVEISGEKDGKCADFFHRSRCDVLHLLKTAREFCKTDAYFADMATMFINATTKELRINE